MTEVVIVPAEPTPEMVEAGWRAKGGSHEGRPVWKCTVDVQVALIYLAMLAARPAAPTQSAAQTGEVLKARVDTLVNILAPDQGESLSEERRRLFAIASAIQSDLHALSQPEQSQ